MDFIPDTPKDTQHKVPYFEDATGSDGWQGQSTTKSTDKLKLEVAATVERLGGVVRSFQRGKFQVGKQVREGFRLSYMVESADSRMIPGRIDIAALPTRSSAPNRREQSLRMALYMLRISLDGTWFLQQLSPGYSALMPFMIGPSDRTISQLWGDSTVMKNLLPPGDSDFIDGEYRQV
jgi:hypothetical protein